MNDIHDLDDYFNTDFNQDGFVPEKGIHRQKGRESVMIDGKLYWAPRHCWMNSSTCKGHWNA